MSIYAQKTALVEPGVGHNSGETTETSQTVAAGQLRASIERIENLLSDRAAIQEDIAQVYAELKGQGFDTAAVRTIVKMRKKDSAKLQEEMAIVELYGSALGMGVFG